MSESLDRHSDRQSKPWSARRAISSGSSQRDVVSWLMATSNMFAILLPPATRSMKGESMERSRADCPVKFAAAGFDREKPHRDRCRPVLADGAFQS